MANAVSCLVPLFLLRHMTVTSLALLVRPITDGLKMNYTEVSRVLGAWQLVYIATALPCGAMIEGLRRSLLITSENWLGFSCMVRGFAQGQLTLFLVVTFFGLGGPLISVGTPKLISIWFNES